MNKSDFFQRVQSTLGNGRSSTLNASNPVFEDSYEKLDDKTSSRRKIAKCDYNFATAICKHKYWFIQK
jgi:hypothetical protein